MEKGWTLGGAIYPMRFIAWQCDFLFLSAVPPSVIPSFWRVTIVGDSVKMVRLKYVQDIGEISTLIHKAPQTPTSSSVGT